MVRMRQYIYKTILVSALVGTCNVHIANAGFEFTAPIQTSPAQQQAIPSLNGSLLPTLPNVQIEGGDSAMPAVPASPVNNQPLALAPQLQTTAAPRTPVQNPPQTGLSSLAPQQPMTQNSAPKRAPSRNGYEMAVGFGKDLPLVTALRQIVPSEYAYVLSESVPMGQTVSWDGGRPWNVVLNDMLRPLNMQANIEVKRVSIEPMVKPATRTAMAPKSQAPSVMNDASPVPPMPMTQTQPIPVMAPTVPAPAPVVNMSVSAPHSADQFAAPVAPTPSRIVPKVTRGTWSANRGDSLRSVLQEWSGQAGAELFWSSDFDYPLAGAVNISGTFEEATENLLKGFEQARPKPIARLHPNLPHGPAVLVVETRQSLE